MSYPGVGVSSGSFYYSTSDTLKQRFSNLIGDVLGGVNTTRVSGIAGIAIVNEVPQTNDSIIYNGSNWDFSAPVASAHNLLSATHSDTAAASPVRGDLIVGNSTPAWARKAKGAAGEVVYSDGTDTIFQALGPLTPFLKGTTLLPSIAISGDANTGLSAANADILYLSAGGSGLLSVDGVLNTVKSEAGFMFNRKIISANNTLTTSDHIVICSGNNFAVTLPTGPDLGRHYVIKDGFGLVTLALPITIVGNVRTIDGSNTVQMVNAYGSVDLLYNGVQWNII